MYDFWGRGVIISVFLFIEHVDLYSEVSIMSSLLFSNTCSSEQFLVYEAVILSSRIPENIQEEILSHFIPFFPFPFWLASSEKINVFRVLYKSYLTSCNQSIKNIILTSLILSIVLTYLIPKVNTLIRKKKINKISREYNVYYVYNNCKQAAWWCWKVWTFDQLCPWSLSGCPA